MAKEPTDEQLLRSSDPTDFGVFYARHVSGVERYFARRVSRDEAGDLAAETFASALVARRHFVPGDTPAVGWLYTIAARRLVDFQRRATVRRRTLEALTANTALPAASPFEPSAAIELTRGLLRHLPRDQRSAVIAHVLGDRDYRGVASDCLVSEATIRQRVSRGLGALRGPLRVYRAAQAIAAQGRGYRFGGGHGKPLTSLEPREALDCSSSASLILFQAGVFDAERAWPSARLAKWGLPGEGHYVTVWANDEHVWLEFKLDSELGERFDPTPLRSRPDTAWIARNSGSTREFQPRHWPDF